MQFLENLVIFKFLTSFKTQLPTYNKSSQVMKKWGRRIAVITGAASRIVEAILKSFVEKGIPVI